VQVSPKGLITFTDKYLYTLPTRAHKLCKIIMSIHMDRSVCSWIIYIWTQHNLSACVCIYR
jgi:hypothetical protein